MHHKLGWIPDVPDSRDEYFDLPRLAVLPPSHTQFYPFAYNQGTLGSCTAQAVCAAFQYTEIEQDGHAITPSRLALYYFTRKDQGSVDYDSGATIRGAMKAAAKYGVGPESLWPYDVTKYRRQPTPDFQARSLQHRLEGKAYARVRQSLPALKTTLAADNPIVFGFSVYEDFMGTKVARSGIQEMPRKGEKMVGGHAVLMIGYDDSKKAFLVKNSWGTAWGYKGCFWMPYAFALDSDLADDFWTLYKVNGLT